MSQWFWKYQRWNNFHTINRVSKNTEKGVSLQKRHERNFIHTMTMIIEPYVLQIESIAKSRIVVRDIIWERVMKNTSWILTNDKAIQQNRNHFFKTDKNSRNIFSVSTYHIKNRNIIYCNKLVNSWARDSQHQVRKTLRSAASHYNMPVIKTYHQNMNP